MLSIYFSFYGFFIMVLSSKTLNVIFDIQHLRNMLDHSASKYEGIFHSLATVLVSPSFCIYNLLHTYHFASVVSIYGVYICGNW